MKKKDSYIPDNRIESAKPFDLLTSLCNILTTDSREFSMNLPP